MKKLSALLLAAVMLLAPAGVYAVTDDRQTTDEKIVYSYTDPDRSVRWSDISIAFTGGIHSRYERLPRIDTLLKDTSSNYRSRTYILDAGDFTGKTGYYTMCPDSGFGLSMLGYMGYDAVTLGDMEQALGEDVLKKALRNGGEPPLNVSDGYEVLKKNGTAIAVFGADDIDKAKRTVSDISKNEEDIDLIVCLSQVGEKNEEALAEQVKDIDLIISGDRKDRLTKPLEAGNALIVSAGPDASHLGHITFIRDNEGKYSEAAYEILPVRKDTPEDRGTSEELGRYEDILDDEIFGSRGFRSDERLTTADTDIGAMTELLADAYTGTDKDTDIAVVTGEDIQGSLKKGRITPKDVYDAVSSKELAVFYVNRDELKSIVSLGAGPLYGKVTFSGVRYTVNDKRLKLNRAVDIEVKDKELYRVKADPAAVDMLLEAADDSYGVLTFNLRDRNGKVITDRGRTAVKTVPWVSLAEYLDEFDKVPASYKAGDGRVKTVSSLSPAEIFRQPNKAGWLLIAAIVLPLLVIAAVIVIILVRRRRRDKNNMFHISERQKKAIFAPPKRNRKIFSGRRRKRRYRKYR